MSLHAWAALFSDALLLCIVAGIPLYALYKKLDVFTCFVEGAEEGFQVAIKILPYWVGFWVALNMFRTAGGFTLLEQALDPLLRIIGLPTALLPLAIMRPFSGGVSNGMVADIAHTYGGTSMLAHMAASIVGSTETTFYIVMVYFGSVGVTRTRYAIPAGLLADIAGIAAAIVLTQWLYLPPNVLPTP